MFSLEQVQGIVEDIFRAEIVKQRRDTFAFFDTNDSLELSAVPAEVLVQATRQVKLFFGYQSVPFTSIADLSLQSYRAYQQNKCVYLSTSGSTGTPKQCLYTQEMMEIEGEVVGSHFSKAKRLLTLTPRQHLYGLSFAVLFPAIYSIPTKPIPPLPVQPWFSILRDGDVVAGFPLFWEYFLKAGNKFPPGVTAVTSTAPCPKGLFARLKQAGASHVAELYGATETGGIGVRHSEEDPFQINSYWEVDATHSPVKIRRKGIDGWVPFPDQVDFIAPRLLFPRKRVDSIVQVAGVNVSPKKVEGVILQHPAVKECRVRLMRPEEGQRMKAFLVLKEGYNESELPKIRHYLTQRLSSHEMPRSFTVGVLLPRNAMGKDADW